MKKNFKLVLALVLALMMVLGSVAFATSVDPDTDGKYTITVTGTHTFKVFQVLTGTLVPGEKELGNAAWGDDATNAAKATEVDDFVTALNAKTSDQEKATYVAGMVDTDGNGQGTISADDPVGGLKVAPGYYVLVDITEEDDLEDGDARSLNVVKVVNNVTVTPKTTTIESHKDVKDINDSNDLTYSDWQKSADYDGQDEFEYRIYAKLPTDHFGDYKKYPLNFVDTMSKGLDLVVNSVNVYVTSDLSNLGTAISTGAPTAQNVSTEKEYADLLAAPYDGGKVWKWSIDDVKVAPFSATAGQYVVITYKGKLNDNAVIGAAGNPNKMYVEYANNPNVDEPQPEGKTTPEVNIVFTYRLDVDKIDGSTYELLSGAGFTLYKQYASAQTDKGANKAADLGKANTEYWYQVGNEQYVASGSTFSWLRVDDGKYILKETHTPTGYNTIDDIAFEIVCSHATNSTNALTNELSVVGTGFQASTIGGELTFKKDALEHKKTVDSGSIATAIENNKGAELPETGGIGTTIFYVAGSIMVLAAAILLITKRRMGAED